jgi:hypothetical protein
VAEETVDGHLIFNNLGSAGIVVSTVRLNISENPVIVVHIEAIIALEEPGLLRFLEFLIVGFHHLLVVEISICRH